MIKRTKNKIRLYLATPLNVGVDVMLDEKESHYLCNVMRLQTGDSLSCFNEHSGEYDCKIIEAHKKHCRLEVSAKLKDVEPVPDIWLLFAPLKKDKTDFVIEKATELGVKEVYPVLTQNTNSDKVKQERFEAQAKEAAEQCERTDIPLVHEAVILENLLKSWNNERILFFLDESLQGQDCAATFAEFAGKSCAVLVGPEGGFSATEKALLDKLNFVQGISLGSRILRAETAVCAALSVWQAIAGDWKKELKK